MADFNPEIVKMVKDKDLYEWICPECGETIISASEKSLKFNISLHKVKHNQ